MAKVLIEYEGNLGNLKAQLAEVEQANQSISDSAKQTAQQVGDEYRKVASTAAKAFAGQEVSKALQDQEKNVDALTESLNDLLQQELKLLAANKQGTKEFQLLQDQLKKTRDEFDRLNGAEDKLNKQIPKTAAEISKLEDRLRELALAGQQGTQEFDDIARAIGEYKAAITTADRAVDLYAKSTDAATGRLGELEDKLYDLALAGQTNTQEFKDTIAQVTNLKRAVFEVDQQVDSYVERSRGFATVVQNVELIGNAFQLVEGAAALFGEENEELQKTLVRLNAILAITQGLEQARTILLEQNAKKTGVAAIAQRGYALAVGTSTGALKAFRLALAASGVGLLVIGLGVLIGKLTETKEETEDLTKANEDLQRSYDNLQKGVQSAAARLNKARLEQLVLEGKLSKETVERINLQNDAALEIDKINEDAARKETERLEVFRKQIKENALIEKSERELLFKDIRTIEQERATLEAAIRLELANKIKQLNKEQSKETVRRVTFEISELKRLEAVQLEILQGQSEIINNNAEQFNTFLRTREQQLLRQILLEDDANKSTLKSEIELIRIQGELQKQSARESIENEQELAATINRIDTETVLKQKELRQQYFEEITKSVFQYVNAIGTAFASIVDLQNELTERRIEQIETLRDKELEANAVLQQSYAQRVRNDEAITLRANRKIVEEKRKQARLDKAQGIFEAVVNTAVAVTSALKEKFPLSIILAAAAGIAGATQIAKISSEPLPSFGKGGWIDGEPHARGGVDINAEGGEFVTRKSQAGTFRRELEAMNTSRAAFLKVIEESYVRPRLAQLSNDRSVNVNVNARLNSSGMESRLDTLTKETRKTRRALTQAMAQSHSQRYSW